jgi:IrrE N-terminal-like domain
VFLPFSKRGKAWEPIALSLRRLAGLGPEALPDPWQLAPKVGLTVVDAQTVLSILDGDDRAHLLDGAKHRWSGGVYPEPLPDGTHLCILNPTHSRRCNKITLMEEIVHTYRNHCPSRLVIVADGVRVRDYDKAQEDEAYGVGAAVLLPWQPFFAGLNAGRTIEELAEQYDVTTDLVGYRIKITGAYHLYQARQRRAALQ